MGAQSTVKPPAGKPAQAAPASTTESEPTPAAETLARSQALSAAVKQYKAQKDPATWENVWKIVREILTQPAAIKAPAASILASNPGFKELGVKIVDGEGARLWCFPNCPESQTAVLHWNSTTVTLVPQGRRRPPKQIVTVVSKSQILNIPGTVVLYDAHLERSTVAGRDKQLHLGPVHGLILTGNTRGSGSVWLQGYKLADGVWVETNEFFSAVPPFLTQNLVGSGYFENNDLVLTVGSIKSPVTKGAQATGYKIVLHFVDGKFSLDAKSGEEGPAFIVLQFIQAVQQGHLDVARGWLQDTRLVSIPKYAGLTKPPLQGFKLLAMANPSPTMVRYRVITSGKDDLVVDLTKFKQAWIIKAIFIVAPDPLAQKLLAVPQATDKAEDAKPDEPSVTK
jgi:hypothetical protein